MKKVGKKNLKLIAVTSMAIFSLLTTFTATFAWFTAMREVNSDNQESPFPIKRVDSIVEEVEFYKYIGTTPKEISDGVETAFYAFDPTPYGSISVDDHGVSGNAPSFAMGTFSLSDPHHLMMVIFKIKHSTGVISARTDYPYIANAKVTASSTVASYSALLSVDKSSVADGTVYEVTSDEGHKSVTTQYTFNQHDNAWEMSYVELQQDNNPLSSAIRCYTFAFEEKPTASNHSVYLYSDSEFFPNNSTTQEVRDTNATHNVSCLAFNTTDFRDSASESFVQITDENVTFTNEITLYENLEDSNANYVAIIYDYYSPSLEYISYKFLGHRYLTDGLGYVCDWETIV